MDTDRTPLLSLHDDSDLFMDAKYSINILSNKISQSVHDKVGPNIGASIDANVDATSQIDGSRSKYDDMPILSFEKQT